jgi:alkylation response protein AidB-like acyl-CoA dehydrogenase
MSSWTGEMASSPGRSLLDAVLELRGVIARRAGEAEKARRLPVDLVEQLKAAHLFRMFVPRSHGGREVDLLDGLTILEELARIDGAVAWTVMIGAQSPHLFSALPAREFDRIYSAGPDVIAAGAMAPQGVARPERGGYRVDGRWSFATGCQHSDWLYGTCLVAPGRGEPGRGEPGRGELPVQRTVVFPAGQARILDNWDVLGMRGSGSHDIAVEALHVPGAYSFDVRACAPSVASPHFVEPPLHIHVQLSAVALGIAAAAIDDLRAIAASGKKRLYARETLVESPRFHHDLGAAMAEARAARTALRDLAARLWRACAEDPPSAGRLAAEVLGTTSWTVRRSADVVTACYREAGAGVVRDGSPLQRRFRDVHAMSQHVAATSGWITQMGAEALGLPARIA